AAKRAGRAVLVGDCLRPGDARADQEHAAREPLLADSRAAEEPEWLDRHLFRTQCAGRQGGKLGADRSRAQGRADGPLLRHEEGVLRQSMEAAGPGAGGWRHCRRTVRTCAMPSVDQLIIWIVVGLIGGGLAGSLITWERKGFGLFRNLGLGLAGAVVG